MVISGTRDALLVIKGDCKMRNVVFTIMADEQGAFVSREYISNSHAELDIDELDIKGSYWLAIFPSKLAAQAYVSFLNQTYTSQQLEELGNE